MIKRCLPSLISFCLLKPFVKCHIEELKWSDYLLLVGQMYLSLISIVKAYRPLIFKLKASTCMRFTYNRTHIIWKEDNVEMCFFFHRSLSLKCIVRIFSMNLWWSTNFKQVRVPMMYLCAYMCVVMIFSCYVLILLKYFTLLASDTNIFVYFYISETSATRIQA